MSSRVVRRWKQENTWVCTSCGTKNYGRSMECVNCGSRKEGDEKYVVPKADPSQAVIDPRLLDLANRGPNWECPCCGGHERDGNGECYGCGGLRHEQDYPTPIEPEYPGEPESSRPHSSSRRSSPDTTDYFRQRDRQQKTQIGLVLLGLAVVIAIVAWIFIPHKIEAEVSAVRWEYTSHLRQKTLMHGEDWGDRTYSTYPRTNKPNGYGPRRDGFNVICEGRYFGTEDCNPYDCNPHDVSYDCNCRSYECNCYTTSSCSDDDNGFSSCTEVEHCSTCTECDTCSRTEYDTCYHRCDVYKDYCSFDYYEWPIVNTKKTGGQTLETYWPNLTAEGPNQRLDKLEVYEATFVRKDKSWTHEPKTLSEFQTYRPGARWIVKVNHAGQVWPVKVAR